MSIDIVVDEALWEGDERGVMSHWLYREGDRVEAGSIVAEVMVEKISFELLAPAAGSLRIIVQADAVVAKGATVGRVV
jgi:pyruvate/2-oxoglutarate dehydrogenase complex dihydrolipoamide acyltransferase (E2) component